MYACLIIILFKYQWFPDAEPSIFSWRVETPKRKSPLKRHNIPAASKKRKQVESKQAGQAAEITEDFADHSVEASPSSPTTTCDDSTQQSEESQTTQALRERMVLLEMKVNDLEEKLALAKSENAALLDRQFSIEKIKDENVAILFYMGFPNYQALVSFYTYIEPKLHKMQYWRGDKQVKESQPYQDDKHRKKPGPSRKLSYFEEMVLVLMRLKAGLFIQDLADRFGISKTLVSKICITWINLLYMELQDIFPFPSQELVRKNMPKEFAEYSTTRIILDCTEIFIERPSAMLAQSETWSEYKHHNTRKVLVGVTPNGQVSYLSDL